MSAIQLSDVGKRYVKYDDTPMLATAALRLRARSRRSMLWAVRHVDLEVDRGACLGVIGRNGCGKSTLLQMLCGVTAPTEGRVQVRGRVAPLISVGVGFHPELTGRENVYVNGAILGMDRATVDARLDEIVDFADIGPFLDTPVKFYSSGMFVRLGFAVAVQARPDVLLVDEVLAVGDLSFQNKCYYKMQEIREAGTTVVVVSHNLLAIRRLCDRVVVMHAGSVRFDGEPGPAISRLHELLDEEPLAGPDGMSGRLPLEAGVVEGTSLEVIGDGRDGASYVASGDRLRLRFTMRAAQPVPHPVYHINVHNAEGSWVYGDTTRFLQMPALPAGEPTSVDIELAPSLVTGSYTVRVGVHRGDADGDALARLAVSQPVTFYVAGRHRAMGVADLQASFTASDREPSS